MSGGVPVWLQSDGEPVSCHEKLEVLNDNYEELRHVMQDAFEDALLMGVDETAMRKIIADLAGALKSPKR
jgi:uncharacterized protein (UPF0335 family)